MVNLDEKSTEAIAKEELRVKYGATDYDGKGPPTEASVGLRVKDFVALPEELVELLVDDAFDMGRGGLAVQGVVKLFLFPLIFQKCSNPIISIFSF